MGWIYGSTIVNDINSTTSANALTHQYDKIFSNRYLMDNTAKVDSIFLGRKVLVDYHQSLTDTLNRVELYNGNYYYWRQTYIPVSLTENLFNKNEQLGDSKKKYCYLEENNYILITEWLSDFDDNTKFFEFKSYTVLDLVSEASISKGTYVYILTGNNQYDVTHFSLLQCTSDLISTATNSAATLTNITYLGELKDNYVTMGPPFTTYGLNKYIDEQAYNPLDYPYDSTVWQKVYINNEEKYIMISQLNAHNPTIELYVKQPGFNGIAATPVLNVDNKDKYDFFVSAQSGLRINNEPYYNVNVYIPGRYYIDNGSGGRKIDDGNVYNPNIRYYLTVDGDAIKMHYTEYPGPNKLYRKNDDIYDLDTTESYTSWEVDSETGKPIEDSHFVFLSDENCKYYYYSDNNTIMPADNKPAAIYYNQAGLSKEFNHPFDTNIQEDCIAIDFNGRSGYEYLSKEYYELIQINDESEFNDNKSKLYYLLSDKGYAPVENYNLISVELYEPNKYYYFDEENKQYVLDTSESAVVDRKYYEYECATYQNSLQYYLLKTTNTDGIDTHQLSINLPTIGNMVCEGWNLIYGPGDKEGKRNLKRYEYDYGSNALIGEKNEVNREENNLTGLYNLYAEEVKRLKGYDESFSSITTDNIKSSIPLITTTEVIENVEFAATHPLENNDIIQNQIAINNLGLQSIIDQIGLDTTEAIGYEPISNVTVDSYQPNLYYYESEPNVFNLDETDTFTENRQYYVCRINTAKVANNKAAGTIQEQINANYDQREANKADLEYRRTDIHKLAELIGLNKTEDGTPEKAAKLAIMSAGAADKNIDDPDEQQVYDDTIQGQIYRNDADITNLINLLGFARSGYDQLSTNNNEQTITNSNQNSEITDDNKNTLQNQIMCNNYDIQKLANRIRRIEEFLEAGHFLFYYGRPSKLKNFDKSGDYKIPGEDDYNEILKPVDKFTPIN